MKHWIISLLIMIGAPVFASEMDAETAFTRGDYAPAITIGRTANTAEGLVLACRAGMILGGYEQSEDKAVNSLHSAIKDCHGAVMYGSKLTESHMNALITLAIGVGFEGKRWQKPAYAKLSRAILEKVYDDFQTKPAAHAAIGGWHSEVSAAGFLPRLYLGASRSKAKRLFGQAMEMGETDLPFRLEYVKLLARGKRDEREKATQLALTHTRDIPREALDRLMRDKLMLVGNALQTGEKHAIKKAIAEATAFNGIEEWRGIPLLNLDFIKQSLDL